METRAVNLIPMPNEMDLKDDTVKLGGGWGIVVKLGIRHVEQRSSVILSQVIYWNVIAFRFGANYGWYEEPSVAGVCCLDGLSLPPY